MQVLMPEPKLNRLMFVGETFTLTCDLTRDEIPETLRDLLGAAFSLAHRIGAYDSESRDLLRALDIAQRLVQREYFDGFSPIKGAIQMRNNPTKPNPLLVASPTSNVILLIVRMFQKLWFRWRMRKFKKVYIRNMDPVALMNAGHMLYDAAQRLQAGEWEYESGGIMMTPTQHGLHMFSDLKLKGKSHDHS